jgi:hypothetical protein
MKNNLPAEHVRLSNNALFAPEKSIVGPKLDPFSTTFLNLSTSYLGPTIDLKITHRFVRSGQSEGFFKGM